MFQQSILSDNGGEFNNLLLHDVAKVTSSDVCTTAAESPRSNSIVKHHKVAMRNTVLKIIDSTGYSVKNALVWKSSAKNPFHNNCRYILNQLVFGKDSNLPDVLNLNQLSL